MDMNYDAVIIGGAFAGASTALLLKRELPAARVLIVERTAQFDRKVGESTTEVSSCFMTNVLGISTYLAQEQLAKQGLRMWFSNAETHCFSECAEIGAKYNARLSGFQVDRAKLDQHLLEMAVSEGCELLRPAKITKAELNGAGKNRLEIQQNGDKESSLTVNAKWVLDASGRAAFLSRKLGLYEPLSEHPINAIWGRFTGAKDWDGAALAKKFPRYANACKTSRTMATNHLTGLGWWLWIIPLKGGDTSVGLVYDQRLFTPPQAGSLAERLKTHFLAHPVGREILGDAEPIEGDTRAYSQLPYVSREVVGDGWAMAGDAAGFLDPLYSSGLDFSAFTSQAAQSLVVRSLRGEDVSEDVENINQRFQFCYRAWFDAIYQGKYYYIGDGELMTIAFLLDIAAYYLGPVRQVLSDPVTQFALYPFDGKPGVISRNIIALYNRRLAALARKKIAAGCYGNRNAGWRLMVGGFIPYGTLSKTVLAGLLRWALAEWRGLWMRPKKMAVSEKVRDEMSGEKSTSTPQQVEESVSG